jgi:hypothetical protein
MYGELYSDFQQWKQDLQARLMEFLTGRHPQIRFDRGDTHALETHRELAAFALGAASVFTKIMGRSMTAEDLEQLIPLYGYVGMVFSFLKD